MKKMIRKWEETMNRGDMKHAVRFLNDVKGEDAARLILSMVRDGTNVDFVYLRHLAETLDMPLSGLDVVA